MRSPLEELYAARKRALEAEAVVLDVEDDADLVPVLGAAIDAARVLSDRTERSFRLQVLADLLGKVADAGAASLLVDVLSDPDESVRSRAAAALGRLAASGRFAEIVRAIEDALDDDLDGPVVMELPALLLDLADDEDVAPPVDLLVRLGDHEDPNVAAEALCALADLELPGVEDLLQSFATDTRPLSPSPSGPGTLGELVRQLLVTSELDREV